MSFRDNSAQKRYEYEIDGQVVIANYHRNGDVLSIDYVEAPEALRGTGAAGKLMKELMETVRRENLKVIPRCGYAASWIARHPEYADLLAP